MKLLPQKFPYFRRAAIMTSGPAPSPRSSSVEMTTVNSFDLPEAQDAARWHPESDRLVDLDKHPGLAMPVTMSLGFRPLVVADCVGDRAIGPHEASLFDMGQKYAMIATLRETLSATSQNAG